MATEEEGRDNIIHERVSMLHEKGYRGFSLSGVKKKWNDVVVSVKNSDGQTISESGETTEEASKKVIDKIDTLFD